MHVLRDLQPYVCTVNECLTPQRIYSNRHEWFDHESQHRRQWLCIYCQQLFSSVSIFSSHLESHHSTAYAPQQLQALIDMCAKPVDKHSSWQCPLCLKERQQLRSHLARHLKNAALFVLPRTLDVKVNENDSNGVQFGSSEEEEELEARIDELSYSDSMSDISEKAKMAIPDLEIRDQDFMENTQSAHPTDEPKEALQNVQMVLPRLQEVVPAIDTQSEVTAQDIRNSYEPRSAQMESVTRVLRRLPVRPLPAFLQLSNEGKTGQPQ